MLKFQIIYLLDLYNYPINYSEDNSFLVLSEYCLFYLLNKFDTVTLFILYIRALSNKNKIILFGYFFKF